MGLFDDIRVSDKINLPDFPEGAIRAFQTKSLGCEMCQYEIDENGKLFFAHWNKENGKYVLVKDGECQRTVGIELYISVNNVWYEYIVLLKKGKVIHIEKVK